MERKVYEMVINETDGESQVFALSLVEEPAIMENWVYLSKEGKLINLKTLNEEKRLIVGPALIPGIEIPRIDQQTGEEYLITFPEKTIELAAQLYLKRNHQSNATLEHSNAIEGVTLVESWLIADPEVDKAKSLGFNLPKGTWMVALKVDNDEIWNDYVKTGKVRGISVEALLEHRELKLSDDTEMLAQQKLEELRELLKKCLEAVDMETSTNISSSYPGSFGDNKKKD